MRALPLVQAPTYNRLVDTPRHYTRHPSQFTDRRPTRADLERYRDAGFGRDDLMGAAAFGMATRLMIFGINPGLWSAAVNAPFAYPGNRFWPSLFQAGITEYLIDASAGMSDEDEHYLATRGVTLTNLVNRATAKASELSRGELHLGAAKALTLARLHSPHTVVIVGITAFRDAFGMTKATLGEQDLDAVSTALRAVSFPADALPNETIIPVDPEIVTNESSRDWPTRVRLWVVPQPSGLNAHETVSSLAEKWREVHESSYSLDDSRNSWEHIPQLWRYGH